MSAGELADESTAAGRRTRIAFAVGLLLVLVLATAPTPLSAEAGSINTCLSPCHGGVGMAPDIEAAYAASGGGHRMTWNPRIVADASAAIYTQGSRMPCDECHAPHGGATTSINSFDESRAGGPITEVRQLCEGCHRPHDSLASTPTVCGLELRRLTDAVPAHADASVQACSDCHGASGHAPADHGSGGGVGPCESCHGTDGSHAVHTDAADARGPGGLACGDCHDTGAYPAFATGTDSDGSGAIELDETTACDACHSPGGDYDGVDSALAPSGAMSVGAKDVWDPGAYETSTTLLAGNGRWCAGCHDGDASVSGEEPSLIDGVYAPPVAGDEDGAYQYGTGWGYYTTGHGLASSGVFPYSGYLEGPELECDACHANAETHIDGERRSYDASTTPTAYRQGYRLDRVGGQEPLDIPRPLLDTFDAGMAPLCFQSGCHDFGVVGGAASNFRSIGWNQHYAHLYQGLGVRWSSDYSATITAGADSANSCPSCHNVHGSQRLAMFRDGSLTSDVVERRPGIELWYTNSAFSTWLEDRVQPPNPSDLPRSASDGYQWVTGTANRLCFSCHTGTGFYHDDARRTLPNPPVLAPTLDWTGETGFATDGAEPDGGTAEDSYEFRVEYADLNNDAPAFVTLRIDLDDDGDCADASETVVMEQVERTEVTYWDGVRFRTSLALPKAGDGTLAYRFETSDGSLSAATETRTVTISNAAPRLAWTGETGFGSDGANPNSGTTASTAYQFRVEYRDADGEDPVGGGPTLYVDANDDGDYGDAGEVVVMTPLSGGDVATGRRYVHTTTLTRGIDGVVPYYFAASDGIDATQTTVSTVSVSATPANNAPALNWTGESDYERDGADPGYLTSGFDYTFRIEYTDADADAPSTRDVLIDLDDDGSYEAGERFAMNDAVTAADADMTDGDTSNGEYYEETVNVPSAGDGIIAYCFDFVDANSADALGDPQDDGSTSGDETVLQYVPTPVLSWTGEPEYVSDGVYPNSQTAWKPYYFRVTYTDADDDVPDLAQVWIDLDDDGAYESHEKYDMDDPVEADDTTLTDGDHRNGEAFAKKVHVPAAGDGTFKYCFSFADDEGAATGAPQDDGDQSDDRTFFAQSSGVIRVPHDYPSIQAAIDDGAMGDIILVSDGVWEPFRYDGLFLFVESVNGPEHTIIEGDGTGPVVFFNDTGPPRDGSDNCRLDGFTVRGGTYGVLADNVDDVNIYDCIIEDNAAAGILYTGGNYLWLDRSIVRRNQGGGYVNLSPMTTTDIRTCTISENSTDGPGAGLNVAGLTTVADTTVSDNTAGTHGGGYYCGVNGSYMVLWDCMFEGNRAEGGNGGAIAHVAGGGQSERVVMRGNYAAGDGGAAWMPTSTAGGYLFFHDTITGNYAGGHGGGVYAGVDSMMLRLDYCTLSGNSALTGGGIKTEGVGEAFASVWSCILYGDESRVSSLEEMSGTDYLNSSVRYTDINQVYAGFYDSTGSYTTAPSFKSPVPASAAPTTTGDYHLQTGSPCEGAGDPTTTWNYDRDNESRPQGSGFDSGSDEIGSGAAMKFGPVGGALAVPSDETTHTGPPDLPAPPRSAARTVNDLGFLLVGAQDAPDLANTSLGVATKGIATDTAITAGEGPPLGLPEPAAPAASLGLLSLLALAWKALGRVL